MRIVRFASVLVAGIALAATLGSVSASAQSADKAVAAKSDQSVSLSGQVATPAAVTAPTASEESVSVSTRFATLARVKAVPMSSGELNAVKGMHVHFLDGDGGFHLAGDVKTMNNWQNLGGSDGEPVAPSYHGLCVAQGVGVGGITIPGAAVQCP